MLESRYREVKQCEFCGLRTDHVDEMHERAFVANVDRYATTCMNCWDEMHLRWCARTALGVAIATAAQAAASAEEHGWVMPERVERISARCFECGATATETKLVRSSDGNWDCKDEWACSDRVREAAK
jgi:hypothetical protein